MNPYYVSFNKHLKRLRLTDVIVDEIMQCFIVKEYKKGEYFASIENRFHTQDKIDLLNALKDKFGADVIKIVEKVEGEKAQLEWQNIAKQTIDNSIESLIRLLWEPLKAKGFEYTCEILTKFFSITSAFWASGFLLFVLQDEYGYT